MTVLNELPSWDWSSLFRPHLWGYLLFGLDSGVSWEWWLPAIGMIGACYLFIVTINPRRPVTAALISLALFFTPLVQWWYGPSTMWPIAWALLAMAGCVWILVDKRRWVRFLLAGLVGYFAVTMAMGLYVPYIVPAMLVFVCFAAGYFLRVKPWQHGGFRAAIAAAGPYLVAGTAAIAVTLAWVVAHFPTFEAIFSTVYPGQRSEPTGALLSVDPHLMSLAGAPWDGALKATAGETILGANSSEASSVILLSLFLLPALVWFAIDRYRRSRTIDWPLVLSVLGFLVVTAYLLVPGWDAVAHVLQLDRVPAKRFKIVFVVLLPLFAALTIEQVDRAPRRLASKIGAACAAFTIVVLAGLWLIMKRLDPTTLGLADGWKYAVVAIVVATVLLFIRRGIPFAAAALLIASLLVGWNVNPLYRGVFDLSETKTGKLVTQTNDSKPGTWVGVGSNETLATLVQSGVSSFTGVQNYPSRQMWKEIDPTSRYINKWNRLAHVEWTLGTGIPTVGLAQEDLVVVKLDPCSAFAQKYVTYVLLDSEASTSSCLVRLESTQQGSRLMRIYAVVPPSSGG